MDNVVPSENQLQAHDENVDPEVARVMSKLSLSIAVIAFVVLVLCPILICLVSDRSHRFCCRAWQPFTQCQVMSLVILFLITSSIAVKYSNSLQTVDDQDYQGKMRVVGVSYRQQREQEGQSKSPRYVWSYHAVFTLDWGYEWACPMHNNVQCKASEVTYCTRRICSNTNGNECSSTEQEAALKLIVECAEEIYNPDNESYDMPIDWNEGPSNDLNWPSIVAYGDCNSCRATLQVPSNSRLKRLRYATLAMTCAMAFVLLIMLSMWLQQAIAFEWRWRRESRAIGTSHNERVTELPQRVEGASTPSCRPPTIPKSLCFQERLQETTMVVAENDLVMAVNEVEGGDDEVISVDAESSLDLYFDAVFETSIDWGKEESINTESDKAPPVSSRRLADTMLLRLPSAKKSSNGDRKDLVSCVCAICLSPFRVDEQVSWSPHDACTHAFHTSCLMEYANASHADPRADDADDNVIACPLCRHPFA